MTVVKITGRHPMAEELAGYTFAHGRKAKAEEGEAMLVPCPFCGEADVGFGRTGQKWQTVACNECGAEGPCTEIDRDLIIKKWNTRAAPQPLSNPLSSGIRDALYRELHISSDLDHRSWQDIERAFASLPAEGGARGTAIEECAKVCDKHAAWAEDKIEDDAQSIRSQLFATISNTANDCASLIRDLNSAPQLRTSQQAEMQPNGDAAGCGADTTPPHSRPLHSTPEKSNV